MKINKGYNLGIMTIMMGAMLLFANPLWSSPSPKETLRLQIGTQDDTFDRIKIFLELQKIFAFLAERDKLPSYNEIGRAHV